MVAIFYPKLVAGYVTGIADAHRSGLAMCPGSQEVKLSLQLRDAYYCLFTQKYIKPYTYWICRA